MKVNFFGTYYTEEEIMKAKEALEEINPTLAFDFEEACFFEENEEDKEE